MLVRYLKLFWLIANTHYKYSDAFRDLHNRTVRQPHEGRKETFKNVISSYLLIQVRNSDLDPHLVANPPTRDNTSITPNFPPIYVSFVFKERARK